MSTKLELHVTKKTKLKINNLQKSQSGKATFNGNYKLSVTTLLFIIKITNKVKTNRK